VPKARHEPLGNLAPGSIILRSFVGVQLTWAAVVCWQDERAAGCSYPCRRRLRSDRLAASRPTAPPTRSSVPGSGTGCGCGCTNSFPIEVTVNHVPSPGGGRAWPRPRVRRRDSRRRGVEPSRTSDGISRSNPATPLRSVRWSTRSLRRCPAHVTPATDITERQRPAMALQERTTELEYRTRHRVRWRGRRG
jgi:hypothetical protein